MASQTTYRINSHFICCALRWKQNSSWYRWQWWTVY